MNLLQKKIAVACRIMPLYRLGVFKFLSAYNGKYEFTFFGDTLKEGGIETIPWEYSNKPIDAIRWIKTKNFFYIPERLLWQTGIVRRIFFSDFKCFIFEGGVAHLPTWLFAILCKLCGRKVLFWTHGFKGTDNWVKLIIRILYFKYLADGLLLYGHFQRNLMIKQGFNPDKLFVIYNSLDVDNQLNIFQKIDRINLKNRKAKLFKMPDAFTIIFIGRLVKSKKILEVLTACNEIKKRDKGINCLIIGDGPEKEVLKLYIAEKKLEDNVYLTGEIYDEKEIGEYFLMSDLMVSPGNVGLNCIHSMVYGVPVLTHNNFKFQNPEVEAIIPGKTGLLYEYGNFNSMVERIGEWEEMRESKINVVKNCHLIINTLYNPVNHGNRIIDAIDQIL